MTSMPFELNMPSPENPVELYSKDTYSGKVALLEKGGVEVLQKAVNEVEIRRQRRELSDTPEYLWLAFPDMEVCVNGNALLGISQKNEALALLGRIARHASSVGFKVWTFEDLRERHRSGNRTT